MRRASFCLVLGLLAACHGRVFGGKTTEEDKELNNFAEARTRAATYYDGGDFDRAAIQYKKALGYRPDHIHSQLGLAYSLLGSNRPSNLVQAVDEFDRIGARSDLKTEVKRVYGLALTYRSLAAHFERRSRIYENKGRRKDAAADKARARKYAGSGIEHFESVLEIDERLAQKQPLAPMRISASLAPDAHAGLAHCEILRVEEPAADPRSPVNARIEQRLRKAEYHINEFARIARTAREFWTKRRERIMTVSELPLNEEAQDTRTGVVDPITKERYDERIANTMRQEIAIRRALFDTLLFLNRFPEAIREATAILELDDDQDEVLYDRGNAYAWLTPPNYRLALADLKEYRRRQDLGKLTDKLVHLNRRIRDWEQKLDEQP